MTDEIDGQGQDYIGAEFGLPPLPEDKPPAWYAPLAESTGWRPPAMVSWQDWWKRVLMGLIALATNGVRDTALTAEVLGRYRRDLPRTLPETMHGEPLRLVPLAEAVCGFKPFPLCRARAAFDEERRMWEPIEAPGGVIVNCLPIFAYTPMFRPDDEDGVPRWLVIARVYGLCDKAWFYKALAEHQASCKKYNRSIERYWTAECVDLLAWRADDPSRWYSRTDLAGPVLGRWGDHLGDYVTDLGGGSLPLRLYPDPYSWNRAGAFSGDGCCLLERGEHAPDELRTAAEIIIPPEHESFATEIYQWLRKPVKRRHPEIHLREAQS